MQIKNGSLKIVLKIRTRKTPNTDTFYTVLVKFDSRERKKNDMYSFAKLRNITLVKVDSFKIVLSLLCSLTSNNHILKYLSESAHFSIVLYNYCELMLLTLFR